MATAASDTPTVSIVTLLADRRHFIPLLRKCVELQTYPTDKIEWVIVDDGQAVVAFPSDTGPTEELWEHLNGLKRLDAVFLEISFPDSLAGLAETSGHHCTKSFVNELQKLKRPVRWIVVHRKPRYAKQIAEELAAYKMSEVELVPVRSS